MALINVIPSFYINVKFYGAKGDGVADDTNAITNALAAAAAASSGSCVFFPPGIYLTGPQTLLNHVHIRGAGHEASIIKLKNGANADLFSASVSSINLAASFGSGSTGGVNNFSIQDITLDGNSANQTDAVANPTVAATTGSASNAGGNLLASTSYTFGYTYKTAAGETKLVSATTAYTPPAGTNTNQITLTAPALPAGATGTNWYLTASADGAAKIGLIGTSATNAFAVTSAPSSWNPAVQSPFLNFSTVSYPLRFYGYAYILHNIRIRNGYSGGVLVDWNGGLTPADTSNDAEFQISNFHIHDTRGIGLQVGGGSDSQIIQGKIYRNDYHSLHLAPNAQAIQVSQVHCYSETHGDNAVAYLVEGSSSCFVNCEAEGSDVVEVVMLANQVQWRGGRVFTAGLSASGIQIGQAAGQTPYPGSINQSGGLTTAVQTANYDIDTRIYNCEGANGSIWFANDGVGQVVADITNATGTYIGGSRLSSTVILINGKGISSTGALANTPAFLLQNAGVRGGTHGWTRSSSVQTLGNNGTISPLGVGYARITTTGAVTGIIVSQGSFDGQSLWVVNTSANSITFAAAGTSHVADGATLAIAGNTARLLIYDTTTGLWFRAA